MGFGRAARYQLVGEDAADGVRGAGSDPLTRLGLAAAISKLIDTRHEFTPSGLETSRHSMPEVTDKATLTMREPALSARGRSGRYAAS
jgi:hypothetical protein